MCLCETPDTLSTYLITDSYGHTSGNSEKFPQSFRNPMEIALLFDPRCRGGYNHVANL